MRLFYRSAVLWLSILPLGGCLSPPPVNESLRAQLPDLFSKDSNSYILIVKPSDIGFAVEHRIFFNGIGPKLIGTQEAYVWKVAPGIHFVTYSMWIGGGTTPIEVLEGDRAVLSVVGGTALQPLYFFAERENLGTNLRLKAYFDLSQEAPPEPPRRKRQ